MLKFRRRLIKRTIGEELDESGQFTEAAMRYRAQYDEDMIMKIQQKYEKTMDVLNECFNSSWSEEKKMVIKDFEYMEEHEIAQYSNDANDRDVAIRSLKSTPENPILVVFDYPEVVKMFVAESLERARTKTNLKPHGSITDPWELKHYNLQMLYNSDRALYTTIAGVWAFIDKKFQDQNGSNDAMLTTRLRRAADNLLISVKRLAKKMQDAEDKLRKYEQYHHIEEEAISIQVALANSNTFEFDGPELDKEVEKLSGLRPN